MRDYSPDDVQEAWEKFIAVGTILPGKVDKGIAESWLRSRGVDPERGHRHQLPNRMLQARLARNLALISVARLVMQDISELEGQDFVLLADRDGYILEVSGDPHYQEMLGTRFTESDVGTNAVGTTLATGNASIVRGAEHYARYYHRIQGAAIPIHGLQNEIAGVLGAFSVSGSLPENIMQFLKLGVRIIENQIQYKSEQSQMIHVYHNTCSSIIDFFQDGVFVVDAQHNIINVNESALRILGYSSRDRLIGEFLGNVVSGDGSLLARLLSSNPNEFISRFTLKGEEGEVPCAMVRRRITRNPDGTQQTVLGFVPVADDRASAEGYNFAATYGDDTSSLPNLAGHSEKWNEIKKLILKAARVSSNVLIEGESGTGKELVARAIHDESGLSGPFIAINCGAIPKELLQSELFGYEEGAFTGARKGGGIGLLEQGDGGTVFLDEIGEMPFDMQVNLLRFLQDKMITRIGGSAPRKVEVRIIAATNRRLKLEVSAGRFREDLFYRLNVIGIEMPPLRERKLDIPPITRHFILTLCRQFKRDVLGISDAAMQLLCQYDWPGNARELRNVIENAVVFTDGTLITEETLPSYIKERQPLPLSIPDRPSSGSLNPGDAAPELPALQVYRGEAVSFREGAVRFNRRQNAESEREDIIRFLNEYGGNISQVARAMGTARSTIYRKLKAYKIEL